MLCKAVFQCKSTPTCFNESMSFGQKLARLCAELGVSQSELGRRVGVKPQAANQWFNRRTRPSMKNLERIAEALDIDLAEFLRRTMIENAATGGSKGPLKPANIQRANDSTAAIPEIAAFPSAGGGSQDIDEWMAANSRDVVAVWSIPKDYFRGKASSVKCIKIVRVRGKSMEPEYPDGEAVFVDISKKQPSPDGDYILWDGFGLVIKRLQLLIGTSPLLVRINSLNPEYLAYERPLSDVSINGRVIGKWTWK